MFTADIKPIDLLDKSTHQNNPRHHKTSKHHAPPSSKNFKLRRINSSWSTPSCGSRLRSGRCTIFCVVNVRSVDASVGAMVSGQNTDDKTAKYETVRKDREQHNGKIRPLTTQRQDKTANNTTARQDREQHNGKNRPRTTQRQNRTANYSSDKVCSKLGLVA